MHANPFFIGSYERLRYPRECDRLRAAFLGYFQELGYELFPEEPLLPRDDRTLLFTNAFIVGLKPMIRSGAVKPGTRVIMTQRCLRVQNLKRDPLDTAPLAYMSRFEMLGGLIGTGALGEVIAGLHEALTERLGLAADRLYMKASARTKFFNERLEGTGWASRTLFDTEPARYYQWSYGEAGLDGCGVTFAYLDKRSGELRDFGNIVELRSGGEVVGYEFGFGLETLVARKHGLRGPMQVSLASAVSPFWDAPSHDGTKDLLMTAFVLAREGVEPGRGGARSVLRKALRGLARQLESGHISEADLASAIRRLCWANGSAHAPQPGPLLEMIGRQRQLLAALRPEIVKQVSYA